MNDTEELFSKCQTRGRGQDAVGQDLIVLSALAAEPQDLARLSATSSFFKLWAIFVDWKACLRGDIL